MSSNPEDSATRGRSGQRILIAGTGGQGVLTAARLLASFFASRGQQVVSGQAHGMAQRGGSVQATVMVDAGPSPVLARGTADYLLGFEPVETVRALPFVSDETVVLMNRAPVSLYLLAQQYIHGNEDARYPDVESLVAQMRQATPRLMSVDATALAVQAGSVKTLNIVMLGCLFATGVFPYEAAEFGDHVMGTVPARFAEVNRAAMASGMRLAESVVMP